MNQALPKPLPGLAREGHNCEGERFTREVVLTTVNFPAQASIRRVFFS